MEEFLGLILIELSWGLSLVGISSYFGRELLKKIWAIANQEHQGSSLFCIICLCDFEI